MSCTSSMSGNVRWCMCDPPPYQCWPQHALRSLNQFSSYHRLSFSLSLFLFPSLFLFGWLSPSLHFFFDRFFPLSQFNSYFLLPSSKKSVGMFSLPILSVFLPFLWLRHLVIPIVYQKEHFCPGC